MTHRPVEHEHPSVTVLRFASTRANYARRLKVLEEEAAGLRHAVEELDRMVGEQGREAQLAASRMLAERALQDEEHDRW